MLSISLPALHLGWLRPAGDSDSPHQERAIQQRGSSSITEEIVLMKPEHICCLSAGISPVCATVHPSPLSRLHIPGSRARTQEEAAQQGRLAAMLHSRAQVTGTVCPHCCSLSTPRDPQAWATAARPGHGSAWIPQTGERAPGWYKLGNTRARRAAQGFTQPSRLLSPLTHQPGLGPDTPFCCCPGWGPAPRVPSGHAGGRGFPPPTSGGQQPAALGLCTGGCRWKEIKPDPGKQWNSGKDPAAWTQDALSTP